jgi:integrase
MAYLYRTRNRTTGELHPLWRYQIRDYLGQKKTLTGTTNRQETERLALRAQAREYSIRDGVLPAPKPSDQVHDIDILFKRYAQWGESQGGRGGRPWAPRHAMYRANHLAWWKRELHLKTQLDLVGMQVRVERIIHRLSVQEGHAGKTVMHMVESLRAFCRWCYDREYLRDLPLRRLGRIDCTPKLPRRALTTEEIQALLFHASPSHRLVYQTALTTGLRANELRHITPRHLDLFRGGIRLEPAWTKNRKGGLQRVPQNLMTALAAAAKDRQPDERLLDFPDAHSERFFDEDRRAAGIAKIVAGDGKVDFHSLRTTFCTLLDMEGASAKENMELARHSTPVLTMSSYVRSRDSRMRSVVEAIGQVVKVDVLPEQSPNAMGAKAG